MAGGSAQADDARPHDGARARRERRRRAEARLRLTLVRDGACLVGHRGGPAAGHQDVRTLATLRSEVVRLSQQVTMLAQVLERLEAKAAEGPLPAAVQAAEVTKSAAEQAAESAAEQATVETMSAVELAAEETKSAAEQAADETMSAVEQDSKPAVDLATVVALMATGMAASALVDAEEACRNCAGRGVFFFGPCMRFHGSGRAADVDPSWAAASAKSDEEDAEAAADAGPVAFAAVAGKRCFGPCSACGGSGRVAGDAAPLR